MTAPDWIIEQLHLRENENGLYTGTRESGFNKGDAVSITSGPFLDCEGIFDGLNDQQRVIVLLDIMGQQVRTSIAHQNIRAAS